MRNRSLQNFRFEQCPNRKQLFDISWGQGGYNRPPVGDDCDQTLGVKLPQRFANRNTADMVLSRDRVLTELSAFRNFSANNLVAQLIGNRRSERLSRDCRIR